MKASSRELVITVNNMFIGAPAVLGLLDDKEKKRERMIHFIYEFLSTVLINFIFGQITIINHLTFYTFLRTMINIDLDFITLSFITHAFLWRFFFQRLKFSYFQSLLNTMKCS